MTQSAATVLGYYHVAYCGEGREVCQRPVKSFFFYISNEDFCTPCSAVTVAATCASNSAAARDGGPSHSCVYHISGLGVGCHNYHAWRNGDRSINVSFYDIHEE